MDLNMVFLFSMTAVIAVLLSVLITLVIVNKFFIKPLKDERNKYENKWRKELNYRKSSEVRVGKIGENLAPFTKDWPWDPGLFRFLGNPVDGIQFNDDEIIFIEVKTGGSRLSAGQKRAMNLIKEGKVSFATFRIAEDGGHVVKILPDAMTKEQ